MNFSRLGNMQKLIAVALTLAALVFIFGFALNSTEGGGENKEPTTPNTGDIPTDEPTENEDTENKDNEPEPPKYTSYITGLECSEEGSYKKPFAFVTSSTAPIYGISDAELVIEIPIENMKTRYLVYLAADTTSGKIGALDSSRGYIADLVSYFGGILTAYGSDDLIEYQSGGDITLDLSSDKEFYYTENAYNIYTDMDKLSLFMRRLSVDSESRRIINMPYRFANIGEYVFGNTEAQKITIPYAEKTALVYNRVTAKYTLTKSDREKIDMLTGDSASFTNAFILFADSTTYERSEGVETVYDVHSGGFGYYVSRGRLMEIRWSEDSDGNLVFRNLSGEVLTVNRGSSYIGFYKSSVSQDITFE